MPRHVTKPTPSNAEFEILAILWEQGALPVRAVLKRHNELSERALRYTTVLAMLQVLRDKGWVRLLKVGREFIWAAAVSRHFGRIEVKHWFVQTFYEGDRKRAANDIRRLIGPIDQADE